MIVRLHRPQETTKAEATKTGCHRSRMWGRRSWGQQDVDLTSSAAQGPAVPLAAACSERTCHTARRDEYLQLCRLARLFGTVCTNLSGLPWDGEQRCEHQTPCPGGGVLLDCFLPPGAGPCSSVSGFEVLAAPLESRQLRGSHTESTCMRPRPLKSQKSGGDPNAAPKLYVDSSALLRPKGRTSQDHSFGTHRTIWKG